MGLSAGTQVCLPYQEHEGLNSAPVCKLQLLGGWLQKAPAEQGSVGQPLWLSPFGKTSRLWWVPLGKCVHRPGLVLCVG